MVSRQQLFGSIGIGLLGSVLIVSSLSGAWRVFACGLALLVTVLTLLVVSSRAQVGGVSRHVLATERLGRAAARSSEANRQRLVRLESSWAALPEGLERVADRTERSERRLLAAFESGRAALETSARAHRTTTEMAEQRRMHFQERLSEVLVTLRASREELSAELAAIGDLTVERLSGAERRLVGVVETLRETVEDGLSLSRQHAAGDGERFAESLSRTVAHLETLEAKVADIARVTDQMGPTSERLVASFTALSAAHETLADEVVRPVGELLGRVEPGEGVPISESVLRIERALDDVHLRLEAIMGMADGRNETEQTPLRAGDEKKAESDPLDSRLLLVELQQRLRDVVLRRRQDRMTPSFHEQYSDMRRQVDRAVTFDPDGWHPYRQTKRKLRNYEFAVSHGVSVPDIYKTWPDLETIDLEGLPERFALKSDFGASGHGVMLLERASGSGYRRLDKGDVLDESAIRAHLRSRVERGDIAGPYFAEELLVGIEEAAGGIPEDVKIYACYGEVAQVMLRRSPSAGNGKHATFRYLNANGQDLGRIVNNRVIDPSIPSPPSLPEMVNVARHLSRALGTPLCRVDLYESARGIVLGELTLTPGGPQLYEPEHDAFMGAVWRDGELARELDLSYGRPFGRVYGDQATAYLYPPDHISRAEDPGSWARTTAPCDEWCVRVSSGQAGSTNGPSEPGERVLF